MSVPKTHPEVSQDAPEDNPRAPQTFAENLITTFKVLAGMGLVGGALWMANLWTAAK